MTKNNRVLLSMSGGIDSTVAAILLKEQGYEIVGVTYRTWDSVSKGCFEKEKGCCTIDAIMEAKRMATEMGFEHHFLDIRERFKESVIKNFVSEYLIGRTPNPCVVCNAEIKWGEVLKLANRLDCYYIATGHYAQVERKDEKCFLKKGVDTTKDQTYFLWQLPQSVLERTIFPLGKLTKTEVRKIAFRAGFEKLSQKTESQEICFIPDNDYREFLKQEVKDYENICFEGNFIDVYGNVLGRHSGYPNYTIGQRKGLGIALGHPMFVKEIKTKSNEVVLADRDNLYTNYLYADRCRFVSDANIKNGMEIEARIRYKTPEVKAVIQKEENRVKLTFLSDVWAIAAGQSVVFYKDNLILGGGIIM